MPPRDLRACLHDIVVSCEAILLYVKGRGLEAYKSERLLRAGVEREFITIGEALVCARHIDPSLEDFLTSAHQIIGFRNQLTHNYDQIKDETVWGIILDDLPRLLNEARDQLDQWGGPL